MGLDATVYCDCFEKGRLKLSPEPRWNVHVDESGLRVSETPDMGDWWAFEQWNTRACDHEGGVLLHHRIGNIAAVGLIRKALSAYPMRFPLLLSKVVYNGTHCGDFISFDTVPALLSEVDQLGDVKPADDLAAEWIADFHRKLSELIEAAKSVQKPVSF